LKSYSCALQIAKRRRMPETQMPLKTKKL